MAEQEVLKGSRLIKNSVLSTLNSTIVLIASFVTSVIVARMLKPENYGILNLVLWFTGLATWAIGMGLIQAVTKYVAEFRGRGTIAEVNTVIVFVMRIEIVLAIIVTTALLFFKTAIADYFFTPNESFYFALAFAGILPGLLTAVFSASIEGMQKFEHFTRFTIVSTPLALGAKVGVLYFGYKIDGLLIVNLLFSVINTLFFYRVLRKEKMNLVGFTYPENGKEIKGKVMRYNWTVAAIQTTAKVVWDKSENFFLGRFCPAVEIGFYNLAFNVAQRFMTLLPSTFWKVLFPAMSEYFGTGDKEKMRRLFFVSSRYIAFVSFPLGIAGIVLAFPLIHFMYGRDFIASKYPLQIFFFSMMITSLSKPGSAILYGVEKQGFILRYSIVLAVINIALSMLLIPRYGAIGATVTYSTVTMAGSIGGLIYVCKVVGLNYPFKSIAKILMSSIIMGIVMYLIVRQKAELFGFLFSMPVGIAVYVMSSLLWGTFEEEDYIILANIKKALPERWRGLVDSAIKLIQSEK